MKAIENTPENKAKIEALKAIKETQWVGNVQHDTIDKCMTAINLFSGRNSGWYTPTVIKIKGLYGYFMINEDGGLHFESRVIKVADKKYKIEHLSDAAFNIFEKRYEELI